MSSILGSADSLSKSAGGLSAGLQERNRYWILFLEGRIALVEGKMRASGELGRRGHHVREFAVDNDAALPASNGASIGTAGGTPAATPGGVWSWPGFTNGAGYSGEEAER